MIDNKKLYNAIKRWIYRKLDELEPIEMLQPNTIFLGYKNDNKTQLKIAKTSGFVLYSRYFLNEIRKYISIKRDDFEIFLRCWVKDRYQMDVNEHLIGVLIES